MKSLKDYTDEELRGLEANAERITGQINHPSHSRAKALLTEIRRERERRVAERKASEDAVAAQVFAEVRDMSLADRIVRAFKAKPACDSDVRMITTIARYPGRDFAFLSTKIGWKGPGALNLKFGTMCQDRIAWLAPPLNAGFVPARDYYSSLLIDFKSGRNETGNPVTTWTLKPQAVRGFQRVGLLRRDQERVNGKVSGEFAPSA